MEDKYLSKDKNELDTALLIRILQSPLLILILVQ